MSKETTYPPCESCNAHGGLENIVKTMDKKHDEQHDDIVKAMSSMMKTMEKTATDMKWMNLIGKFILTTMLGYFVATGYWIFTNGYASKEDLEKLEKTVKRGEELHYMNEHNIAEMSGKIDFIFNKIRDDI